MAYKNTWDQKTQKGKKRLEKLLEVIKTLKWRDELWPKLKKEPLFRGINYHTIKMRLRREVDQAPPSEIGRAWLKVPEKEHIALRLFPDPERRARFVEAANAEETTVKVLESNFPEIKGMNARTRSEIFLKLGVKRPMSGNAAIYGRKQKAEDRPKDTSPWWEKLTKEQRGEFLSDWRSDPRSSGKSNFDLTEKWRVAGCTSEEMLRRAVRALGETRSRQQILSELVAVEQLDEKLDSRLLELVQENTVNTSGVDGVLEKIKQEFESELRTAGLELTGERLEIRLKRLYWRDGPNTPLADLRKTVMFGRNLRTYHQYHGLVPFEWVEEKAQEITGLSNLIDRETIQAKAARAVPGIMRFAGEAGLQGGEDFELPHAGFNDPFVIETKKSEKPPEVMIVNGSNLGIPYPRDMEENPVRRAFATAEERKVDAIILTNTIDLVTTKAMGPRRALEAQFSGRELTLEVVDPIYREEVLRILEGLKDGSAEGELIYEVASESLQNLMTGWRKVTRRPKDRKNPKSKETIPQFSGKVYVIFGHKEEAVVAATAYAECLFITLQKQKEEKAEADMLKRAIERNEKAISRHQEAISEWRELLSSKLAPEERKEISNNIQAAEAEIQRLYLENENYEKRGEELKTGLDIRYRISNVTPEEWQRYMRKALKFMVSLYEDPEIGIPNCKVISKSTSYIQVGDKKTEISIPGHLRVTDSLLHEYTDVYGPRVLRGEMADFAVICHPYGLRYELTAREKDAGGERGSTKVAVAPMCVNASFLREKLADTVYKAHPIGKVVFNELFNPGVLTLTYFPHSIVPSHFSIEALGTYRERRTKKSGSNPSLTDAMIWEEFETDQHWGGQSQATIECKHCQRRFTMGGAVFHMLRLAGYGNGENGTKLPPIHGYTVNDDPTQGHHFDAEHQPHPHRLLYPDMERVAWEKVEAMRKTARDEEREELARWAIRFLLYQHQIRGAFFTTDQINTLIRGHLKPNLDLFDGILRRVVQSRLNIKGISEFNRDPVVVSDTRDVGAINWGSGAHYLKTVEGTQVEGPLYASSLQEMLLQQPFWQKHPERVSKLVRAPLYGREFVGLGTMQAPGGYEWGIDHRNSTTGGVHWGAPLKKTARTDLRRGNYPRIFEGKRVFKTCGDKHFLTVLLTPQFEYLLGPPGAHTDSFAEGKFGFPPNNTGVVFYGLPAGGPKAGPTLLRALLFDEIKRIMESDPRDFDWEAFLPNAL